MIDSAGRSPGDEPALPVVLCRLPQERRDRQDGNFRIASVDPELLFNVLVVADGFQPTIAKKADPAKEPVKVVLSPLDLDKLDPKRVLRGVVLDPAGKPLAGARVSAQHIQHRGVQRVFP